MGVVEVHMSMSLDGFVTGPNATEGQAFGDGGAVLHAWLRSGDERRLVDEAFAAAGAAVGRRVYDQVDGWSDDPPFGMPVFVPTHRPHDMLVKGETTFTFVTDGIESAIRRAKAAAGDKNVHIMGGASTADQALRLGLVDEVHVHLVPVLLGAGTRLFADLGGDQIALERIGLIEGTVATHLRFRVVR